MRKEPKDVTEQLEKLKDVRVKALMPMGMQEQLKEVAILLLAANNEERVVANDTGFVRGLEEMRDTLCTGTDVVVLSIAGAAAVRSILAMVDPSGGLQGTPVSEEEFESMTTGNDTVH